MTNKTYKLKLEMSDGSEKSALFSIPLAAGQSLEDFGEIFNDYNNNTAGAYAHAEGHYTQATGTYSHAEGQESISKGLVSHAEGYKTVASGFESHAEGNKTLAAGDSSHAEGRGSYITYNDAVVGVNAHRIVIPGVDPHIFENTNKYIVLTFNDGSTMSYMGFYESEAGEIGLLDLNNERAEVPANFINTTFKVTKYDNAAIGEASHVEGINTIAFGDAQHVQGKYNAIDATSTYAHIVGNGFSDENRSNAYALDWNGNAWFAGAINCKNKTTTLANLGAAPAVYTYPSGVNGIDANTIVNDYHKFVINCANCAYDHGFLDVDKASGEGFSPTDAGPIIQQTMRDWRTGDKAYRTSVDNGATWGEWIYETPPLVHNVEYRTTERLSGQPVYVRYIHIGSIPANNEITADVGIAANKLVSLEIMTYSAAYNVAMPLPHMDSNNNSISMIGWLTGGVIHVKSFVSFTGYSAFAIIKYTK